MFIWYNVDAESDLERFLIGFRGIVEDLCDDDSTMGQHGGHRNGQHVP